MRVVDWVGEEDVVVNMKANFEGNVEEVWTIAPVSFGLLV